MSNDSTIQHAQLGAHNVKYAAELEQDEENYWLSQCSNNLTLVRSLKSIRANVFVVVVCCFFNLRGKIVILMSVANHSGQSKMAMHLFYKNTAKFLNSTTQYICIFIYDK